MIGFNAQRTNTTLDSMLNITWVRGGGETIWPFDEHNKFHFDSDQDIHMSFKKSREKMAMI